MLSQSRSILQATQRQGCNGSTATVSAMASPSCRYGARSAAPCLQAHAANRGHGEGHVAARRRWRSSRWARQCTAPGRETTSIVLYTTSPQLLPSNPPAYRVEGSGDGAGSSVETRRAGVNDSAPLNDAVPVDSRVQNAGVEQQPQCSEAVGTTCCTPGDGSVHTSHQLDAMPVTTQPSSSSSGGGGCAGSEETPVTTAVAVPNALGFSPQPSSSSSSRRLIGAVSPNGRLGATVRGRGGGWRSPTNGVAAVGAKAMGSSGTRAVDTLLSLGCYLLNQLRQGAGSALYWLAVVLSWPSMWVWGASALLLSQPTQPEAVAQGPEATGAEVAARVALLERTVQQKAAAERTFLTTLSEFQREAPPEHPHGGGPALQTSQHPQHGEGRRDQHQPRQKKGGAAKWPRRDVGNGAFAAAQQQELEQAVADVSQLRCERATLQKELRCLQDKTGQLGYQVSHLEWERDDLQDKLQEAQAQLKQLSQQHGQQQESAYSVARRSTSQQVQQLLPHTRQQAGGAAMAPPVEQLDPYRLLPGRDPEVGFGQQDLVAAVSDFATHVRHMAESLLKDPQHRGALKLLIRRLEDPFRSRAARAPEPTSAGAALDPGGNGAGLSSAEAPLAPGHAGGCESPPVAPESSALLTHALLHWLHENVWRDPLPYLRDRLELDEQTHGSAAANTLALLRNRTARRWEKVATKVERAWKESGVPSSKGSCCSGSGGGAGAEAVCKGACEVHALLCTWLCHQAGCDRLEQQLLSDQRLRLLSLRALRLGLHVEAAHPLLRLHVSQPPGLTAREHLLSAACQPLLPALHSAVRLYDIQQEAAVRGGGVGADGAGGEEACGGGDGATGEGAVVRVRRVLLCTMRPAVCFRGEGAGGGQGAAGWSYGYRSAGVLVREDVMAWGVRLE